MEHEKKHFETSLIHDRQTLLNGERVLIPPLILDSAMPINDVDFGINLLSLEKVSGFFHSRYSNPTVKIMEEKAALLDGAEAAIACSSGMTGVWLVVIALCNAGDNVILPYNVYHEISDFLKYLKKNGISVTLLNMENIESIERSIKPETRMIFIESPTNPMLNIIDIKECSELAKRKGILFVVDNTMLTSYIQKPLALGADLTLYSTTKFINGHGDALGGIICGSKPLIKKIKELSDFAGTVITPFNAWLTLRGMKTLHVRMEKHCSNAMKLSEYLEKHPKVDRTIYPGLPSFPQSKLVSEQMSCGGAIVTFEIKGGKEAGERFIRNLKMSRIATTFGNIETIVYHFATFARPSRNIEAIGETKSTIRCSVGLENIDDIIDDFERAFSYV